MSNTKTETGYMGVPVDGTVTGSLAIHTRVSFWRRLWFVLSAVPRYLISGSIEVP